MTLRLSTGLRNNLAGTTGFGSTFEKGVIDIYSGPQPLSADNAPSGTLLGTVTADGGAFTPGSPANGLSFDAPAGGVVSKAAAQNWKFTGLAKGTPGWCRFRGNAADDGSQSTTLPRLDGSVGTSGADLNLSNLNVDVGTPITVDVFSITIPAQ